MKQVTGQHASMAEIQGTQTTPLCDEATFRMAENHIWEHTMLRAKFSDTLWEVTVVIFLERLEMSFQNNR